MPVCAGTASGIREVLNNIFKKCYPTTGTGGNIMEKKFIKLQIWEQVKDKGDGLLPTASFHRGLLQTLCCQVPVT